MENRVYLKIIEKRLYGIYEYLIETIKERMVLNITPWGPHVSVGDMYSEPMASDA